jgi:hypothetical protein
LDATGEQGLAFWNNNSGNGSLIFAKAVKPGNSLNTFQTDFGTSVIQNFDVGVYAGIGTLEYAVDYYIYPNPARNELTLAGLNASQKDKTVRIYSSLGTLAYEGIVSRGIDKYIVNIENFASGLYCVVISNADGQVVKKIMVTK